MSTKYVCYYPQSNIIPHISVIRQPMLAELVACWTCVHALYHCLLAHGILVIGSSDHWRSRYQLLIIDSASGLRMMPKTCGTGITPAVDSPHLVWWPNNHFNWTKRWRSLSINLSLRLRISRIPSDISFLGQINCRTRPIKRDARWACLRGPKDGHFSPV